MAGFSIMANNKDWVGNSATHLKIIGSSHGSQSERVANDFYATDSTTIDGLLKVYSLPHRIWECACGNGSLSKKLESLGYDVVSTDLIDRGYGQGGINFLASEEENRMFNENFEGFPKVDCILTNPPYKYATEFVKRALQLVNDGGSVVMFLKLTFLEGKKRYNEIFKNTPPRYVFQFVERQKCAPNGDFSKIESSAVAYSWFVWEKGYKGDTIIKWI